MWMIHRARSKHRSWKCSPNISTLWTDTSNLHEKVLRKIVEPSWTVEYTLRKTEVYRNPPHTDQYLHFDFYHPLELKMGVIRTLYRRAEGLPTSKNGKEKEVYCNIRNVEIETDIKGASWNA